MRCEVRKPQVVGVPSLVSSPQTAGMDTISQNKNIVTSFIDALFTKGDLGAVDHYLAGDYVDHDPPMGFPASREGMRAAAATFRARRVRGLGRRATPVHHHGDP